MISHAHIINVLCLNKYFVIETLNSNSHRRTTYFLGIPHNMGPYRSSRDMVMPGACPGGEGAMEAVAAPFLKC